LKHFLLRYFTFPLKTITLSCFLFWNCWIVIFANINIDVLQYQLDGNSSMIYEIIRKRSKFDSLSSMTFGKVLNL
jgi:hypothetical protein